MSGCPFKILGDGSAVAAPVDPGATSGTAFLAPSAATLGAGLELLHDAVRLAPQFDAALTYDASLGTPPTSQGWTRTGFAAPTVETVSGGELIVTDPRSAGPTYIRDTAVWRTAIIRVDGTRMVPKVGGIIDTDRIRLGFDTIGDARGLLTINGESFSVARIGGSSIYWPTPQVTPGTLEIRWRADETSSSSGIGVEEIWYNGRLLHVLVTSALDQEDIDIWTTGEPTETSGKLVALQRIRAAIGGASAALYLATSPTSSNVYDNTISAAWDMSTILSGAIEGASRLRFQYGAGATNPPALNGSDLTLAQLQAEPDPSGQFFRLQVKYVSDGTIQQGCSWLGASLNWSIP